VALELRLREGYDHSYFFIASFIEEHLRFHAGNAEWQGHPRRQNANGHRLTIGQMQARPGAGRIDARPFLSAVYAAALLLATWVEIASIKGGDRQS
jgi:hypothetical protein